MGTRNCFVGVHAVSDWRYYKVGNTGFNILYLFLKVVHKLCGLWNMATTKSVAVSESFIGKQNKTKSALGNTYCIFHILTPALHGRCPESQIFIFSFLSGFISLWSAEVHPHFRRSQMKEVVEAGSNRNQSTIESNQTTAHHKRLMSISIVQPPNKVVLQTRWQRLYTSGVQRVPRS